VHVKHIQAFASEPGCFRRPGSRPADSSLRPWRSEPCCPLPSASRAAKVGLRIANAHIAMATKKGWCPRKMTSVCSSLPRLQRSGRLRPWVS